MMEKIIDSLLHRVVIVATFTSKPPTKGIVNSIEAEDGSGKKFIVRLHNGLYFYVGGKQVVHVHYAQGEKS